MSGRRRAGGEPMKVVYINTQYVETDALSFKSVVQKLTGKNAEISSPPAFSYPDEPKREKPPHNGPPATAVDSGNPERWNSFLTRDLSFKEIDKMLKDLPSLDELHTMFVV